MLERCRGVYGDMQIIEDSPSLLSYQNALYVPIGDANPPAALFDSGRKIIPSAAYFRGPDLSFQGPQVTSYRYSDFTSNTGDETYFYCGHMHDHFGHFLLSSFSRFWPFINSDFDKTSRIVVHALNGVSEYLASHKFARELFASLGLQPENFIAFKEPTRIRNLVVVAPSFEETSFAHPVYAALGNFAGSRLSRFQPPKESRRPVWLSKERLVSGVRRVVNEGELTSILSRKGVEIICPEFLSLAEQAALFRDRPLIGAFVGSALHAAILAPGKAIIAISDSEVIMSSFPLIDAVNRAKAIYLALGLEDIVNVHCGKDASFDSLNAILRPAAVAESVLAAFEELAA